MSSYVSTFTDKFFILTARPGVASQRSSNACERWDSGDSRTRTWRQLSVPGPQGLDQATAQGKAKRGEKPEHIHRTRMVPKRAEELVDGGSLYWVIRGEIACRAANSRGQAFRDKDGVGRCGLVLDLKSSLLRRARFVRFKAGAISRPRMPRANSTRPRRAPPRCPEKLRRELSELGLM